MKLVKSSQPNVIASHKGNPSYEIEFGSQPVEVTDDIANHLTKNPRFEIVTESGFEVKEVDLEYKKELESIKGIGKKTAKDIMTIHKTKENLVEAIERNDRLSFDDDIVEKLKNKYGGENDISKSK